MHQLLAFRSAEWLAARRESMNWGNAKWTKEAGRTGTRARAGGFGSRWQEGLKKLWETVNVLTMET